MKPARIISLQLISFDTLQNPGEPNIENLPGLLFCNTGADTRAAAQLPASHTAFRFVIMGLHEDESSANFLIENNKRLFPWINTSNEIWSSVDKAVGRENQEKKITKCRTQNIIQTQ